jgi:predicted house-cleaning NTP pyrophosphatase (Maf/HAM1 superfamily)
LLRERGVSFEIVPAHAEETVESTPEATVMGNARRKAIAIAEQRSEALVLGVDTEVWFGGKIFGNLRTWTMRPGC